MYIEDFFYSHQSGNIAQENYFLNTFRKADALMHLPKQRKALEAYDEALHHLSLENNPVTGRVRNRYYTIRKPLERFEPSTPTYEEQVRAYREKTVQLITQINTTIDELYKDFILRHLQYISVRDSMNDGNALLDESIPNREYEKQETKAMAKQIFKDLRAESAGMFDNVAEYVRMKSGMKDEAEQDAEKPDPVFKEIHDTMNTLWNSLDYRHVQQDTVINEFKATLADHPHRKMIEDILGMELLIGINKTLAKSSDQLLGMLQKIHQKDSLAK